MRFGIGYDIHRISKERKLVLGGIDIACGFGLAGHSDADVLLHAVCDALLGACSLGDIGEHFPDTDERYCNVKSIVLLKDSVKMIKDRGYRINNIDATVIAEKPKLSPYKREMEAVIAQTCGIEADQVSVKATTHESMGALGRLEGIAAVCIASVKSLKERDENNAA